MKFSRFERKILVAIVAVAVLPMVGALFLGQAALREAYGVGVNPRVGEQLEQGLELYRSHFAALRRHADELSDALADDHLLRTALAQDDQAALQARLQVLLERHPQLAGLSVQGAGVRSDAARPKRAGVEVRVLEMTRPLGEGATLSLSLTTPATPFGDYQRAGELADVYGRLSDSAGQVSRFYLLVYMGFLASAIVLSVAAGVVLSRRVTRRVSLLAEATRRVGAGDLDVQVPIDNEDEVGELTAAFNVMVRDIRDSRVRIETLQRIGAWQELARHLAHEIKNPLTPIQLAVQEVQRSYGGDDASHAARLADARSIVEEEVASLRRMVGEFSAFARLPAANLQPADLSDFLADAELGLRALPEEYGGEGPRSEVRVTPPETGVEVAIDAMMLRRCLDNLVRNALQALRDAGRAGVVQVRGRVERAHAFIEVQDDGPGIAPEDLPRVFDPYFTTKTDGTGLGLPIVTKIVLEHHGDILAEPAVGGGTLLRIRLPRPAGGGRARKTRDNK